MCTNSGLIDTLECYMDELVDCFEDFVTKSLVIISLAIGALVVMVAYALRVATDRNLLSGLPGRHTTSGSFQPEPGGMTVSEVTTNYSPTTESAMETIMSPESETHLQNVQNEKTRHTRSSDAHQQNVQNEKTQQSRNGNSHAKHEKAPKTAAPRSNGANAANMTSPPTQDVNMSLVANESQNTSNATNNGILNKNSAPSFDERILLSIGLTSCCSGNCSKRSLKRNKSTSRVVIRSQPTCIPNCHLSKSRPCSRYMKMKSSCCSMCCADDDKR